MKFFILAFLFYIPAVLADWGKVYEQEKVTYKDFEAKLSSQYPLMSRKEYLSIAINELKKLGSVFFLQKYVQEEIGLGTLNPSHFAWALETEILTEDYRAIRKSIKLWKDAGKVEGLGGYELSVINYGRFLTSKTNDPLDPSARRLMNTEYHDKVIDVIVLRKLEKKDFSNLPKIIQMKDTLYFEDKVLLAVLGECEKYGVSVKKYCKASRNVLSGLKEEYPEIISIQFL